MKNNLKEQLEWLSSNMSKARLMGFEYAHEVSKGVKLCPADLPTYSFSFSTPSAARVRQSGITTLSEGGQNDLEAFRVHDSPARGRNNATP